MDKYFTPAYDPRLDLGEVPAEGLIQAVGWDGMLEVLKERGRKVNSIILFPPVAHMKGIAFCQDTQQDEPDGHVKKLKN